MCFDNPNFSCRLNLNSCFRRNLKAFVTRNAQSSLRALDWASSEWNRPGSAIDLKIFPNLSDSVFGMPADLVEFGSWLSSVHHLQEPTKLERLHSHAALLRRLRRVLDDVGFQKRYDMACQKNTFFVVGRHLWNPLNPKPQGMGELLYRSVEDWFKHNMEMIGHADDILYKLWQYINIYIDHV